MNRCKVKAGLGWKWQFPFTVINGCSQTQVLMSSGILATLWLEASPAEVLITLVTFLWLIVQNHSWVQLGLERNPSQ